MRRRYASPLLAAAIPGRKERNHQRTPLSGKVAAVPGSHPATHQLSASVGLFPDLPWPRRKGAVLGADNLPGDTQEPELVTGKTTNKGATMENQHRKITGYRELSEEEIALMNGIKLVGAQLADMIESLQKTDGLDQRAVSIAKTDLQTGIMWAVRAVAQPQSF